MKKKVTFYRFFLQVCLQIPMIDLKALGHFQYFRSNRFERVNGSRKGGLQIQTPQGGRQTSKKVGVSMETNKVSGLTGTCIFKMISYHVLILLKCDKCLLTSVMSKVYRGSFRL